MAAAPPRRGWGTIGALLAALGALLGVTLWGAADLWRASGVDIGWFGWTVLGVGGLIAVALGAGLMALSFHSARNGYDARADAAAAEIEAAADRSLDRGDGRGD